MKTALVTGATAGFGAAICKLLIQSGYKVIGTGRRKERLAELHSQLGNNFLPLAFDIRDEKATQEALNNRPEGWQAVDLLVNNAGLALGLEPAYKTDLSEWQQMIDTNVKGLVTITRLILPEMVERNAGHIINLSSTAGNYPYAGGNAQKAAKVYENVQYVRPEDIADIVLWLNQQPEHVNINRIEVMPVAQSFAGLSVAKN